MALAMVLGVVVASVGGVSASEFRVLSGIRCVSAQDPSLYT
jgi:hypothetical protein